MKIGTHASITSVGPHAQQVLREALLEDGNQHAVGGARREQVQQDRLDRDDDRAERDQQQQEAQASTKAKTSGSAPV